MLSCIRTKNDILKQVETLSETKNAEGTKWVNCNKSTAQNNYTKVLQISIRLEVNLYVLPRYIRDYKAISHLCCPTSMSRFKNVIKSIFFMACREGNKDLIIWSLQNGFNANTKDTQGISAITYACKDGDYKMVSLLLISKAELNSQDLLLLITNMIMKRVKPTEFIEVIKSLMKNVIDLNSLIHSKWFFNFMQILKEYTIEHKDFRLLSIILNSRDKVSNHNYFNEKLREAVRWPELTQQEKMRKYLKIFQERRRFMMELTREYIRLSRRLYVESYKSSFDRQIKIWERDQRIKAEEMQKATEFFAADMTGYTLEEVIERTFDKRVWEASFYFPSLKDLAGFRCASLKIHSCFI